MGVLRRGQWPSGRLFSPGPRTFNPADAFSRLLILRFFNHPRDEGEDEENRARGPAQPGKYIASDTAQPDRQADQTDNE